MENFIYCFDLLMDQCGLYDDDFCMPIPPWPNWNWGLTNAWRSHCHRPWAKSYKLRDDYYDDILF